MNPKTESNKFWFLEKYNKSLHLFQRISDYYFLFLKRCIVTSDNFTFIKFFHKPWWIFKTTPQLLCIKGKELHVVSGVIDVHDYTKANINASYKFTDKSKKKILIDATTVTSQIDGLSHCILNLIKYLPEDSFKFFEYSILINKGLERKAMMAPLNDPRIKVIEMDIAPIGPKRDWDMFWFLRKYEKNFDLVHITSNNYPFALKKGVCTIHDITFKRFFDSPKYTFNLAQFYMDRVIRNALKTAKAIIAVSISTKDDLVKTYQLSDKTSKKIHVIHNGWEHLVHEIDADDKGCEQEFPLNRDYLLYVGTFRIHKNISRLLQGFQKAMEHLPSHKKMVIIGSDKHLQQADLEVINQINRNGKHVYFTGYLSQACVEKYFKQADAYIFPSFSEGFGLGVLEAFYYDLPLLCSNLTSLPEIAGDAALYFDPYNTDDIAAAIIKFYSDPGLGAQLIAKGKERLKEFSWKKNATAAVQLYEKVLGMNG